MSWSMARLMIDNAPLLAALSSEALPKRDDFYEQEIANTAWALATMLVVDMPLLDALSAESIAKSG